MNSKVYKTYYDVAKITIWQDNGGMSDANAKRPRMILSFRDGNPRFTVYSGEMGPNGVISFPMDVMTFGGIIEMLLDVTKQEPGYKVSAESIGNVWENNKPTDKTRIVSVLHMGKTKEGVVYLSIIEETKPKIVFSLNNSKFHNFRDATKEIQDAAKTSVLIAKGLAETLRLVLAQVVLDYTNAEYATGERNPGAIKGFEKFAEGGSSSNDSRPKAVKKDLVELDSDIADLMGDLDI